MKYLSFIACLTFGVAGFFAAEYLKPFNPELRAAEPAPATKCTFGTPDELRIKVPTEYITVTAYITEADLKRAAPISEKVRRAEFDRKTIAR